MFIMAIAGTVGKDAQLRRTQNGDAILSFSVAVDQGKDKSGAKRDSVWVQCSIWGKRGESLDGHILKGSKLSLSGRPGVNVYDGKGSLTMTVDQLTFQSGSQKRDDVQYREHDAPARDLDDDIPF